MSYRIEFVLQAIVRVALAMLCFWFVIAFVHPEFSNVALWEPAHRFGWLALSIVVAALASMFLEEL